MIPRIGEDLQSAREDFRKRHGRPEPTVGWEDRPVREFNLPEEQGLMDRVRVLGVKGRRAAEVGAVALDSPSVVKQSHSSNAELWPLK